MTQENVSRRNLLRVTTVGAGAAVASGALGQEIALAAYGPAPGLVGRTAIVVGSGFGGAVAAYRLGHAGLRTTVLERGGHGDGVIATHVGDGLDVLSGVGVGGGSLQPGIHMSQPRRAEWSATYSTALPFDLMDQTYWPRARQRLNATPLPADIEAHPDLRSNRAWRELLAEFKQTPVTVPFATDWDTMRAGFSGRTTPVNARNGVDRNYLKWAKETGNVKIEALHEVTEIRARPGRAGFEVLCRRLGASGEVLGTKRLTCDFLFLAAGAVQTTSLLVTAKAKGWLPQLGSEVGKGFGNNGDFLVARLNARVVQSGPGDVMFFDDDNPHVSAAAMTMVDAPAPSWAGRATMHLISSMAPERGEIRYDPATGTGKVRWPYEAMQTRAEKAGLDLATRLWWQTAGRKGQLLSGVPSHDRAAGIGLGSRNTWNPLGGMVMGQATDFTGKSLDYSNLYCVDGSLLPGTACLADPALTITANAERCLDGFIAAHV